MSIREINKKGIDGISAISQALFEGVTGPKTLLVSEGALVNRNATSEAKGLFRTNVLPYLCTIPLNTPTGYVVLQDKKMITGSIVCNLVNGVMRSTSGLVNIQTMRSAQQQYFSQLS